MLAKSSIVSPVSQANDNGWLPPFVVMSIAPSALPQFSSVTVPVTIKLPTLFAKVKATLTEHPPKSVTTTLYVPALRLSIIAVDPPFDHK